MFFELYVKDQFIWLDDLPIFLEQVSKMFCLQGQEIDDLVTKMAIPIMEFTYGDKERGFLSRQLTSATCHTIIAKCLPTILFDFLRTLKYND